MMRSSPFLASLAALLGLAWAAPAADLLLVLSEESGRAWTLDPATLAVVAESEAGAGARAAARAYDRVSGRVKTYVLEAGAVRVLDDRLETLAVVPLPAPPVEPGPALAVARSASRVAVATEAGVLLIDTADDSVDTVSAEAVALAAGPRYLYLLGADSVVRRLDPADGSLLPGGLPLPAGSALVAAPDGSRVHAGRPRALLELGGLPDAAFVARPGVAPAAKVVSRARVASGAGGRSLWSLDGALQASGSHGLRVLAPAAGLRDFALSADGRVAYAANAAGVRALDAETGVETASTALAAPPSAVFFSPDPVAGEAPIIQKVSPDPFVPELSMFDLQVSGPTGGIPLTVTAVPEIVSCTPPPGGLSGLTTIPCEAGPVSTTTQSTVTVSGAGVGSVAFVVTVFPADLPDGVNPIGATSREASPGAQFQLAVEYRQGGAPVPAVQLNVTPGGGAAATCPGTVSTNASGIATATCTATSPEQSVAFTVTIDDGLGSQAVFNVTVLGTGGSGGTLIKVTSEPILVLENANFTLVVEARQNGAPEPDVELTVQTSAGFLLCPSPATTGANGRVQIACGTGQVTQTTSGTVTIREGNVRQVVYTVTVVKAVQNGLTIAGNNNQIVQQGTALPLPLLVAARSNGEPQAGLQLIVDTDPDGLLTCFGPVFTEQNGIAQINCSAGSVQGLTEVAVQVEDSQGRSLPAPFSVTITPDAVGDATQLQALTGLEIEAVAGATLPQAIRVRARNEDGLPVPGAFVFFRADDPGVQFAASPVLTNADGVAEATVTFNCPASPGIIQVGLSAQSTELSFTYRITGGAFASLATDQGDNQSGEPGERLPLALVVRAEDVCGTPLSGVPVSWTVEPLGAASLEATVNVTDSRGRSSTLVRVGPSRFEPFTVRAASGDESATFQVSVANAPTVLSATSGGGQQVAARAPAGQPLVATVTNEGGQPVEGVEVTFVVVDGEGTLANPVTTTNAEGRASALVEAGSTLGPLVVEARAFGEAVAFNLTVIGGVPAVTLDSFTNGGSFRPGWTPGSAASIFGVGLMEGIDGIDPTPFPFPTSYKGVEVRVNGVSAPLFALIDQQGGQQINLQVPFGLTPGTATVELFNNGSTMTVTGVPIRRVQPGIFEIFVEGGRYAAALHADFSVVTPSNPARPGETILLFLTGVGPTDQALETNVPGPTVPLARVTGEVVVGLENRGMRVLGSFYAPGLISVYQINFRVASDVSSGELRLNVRVDDVFSQMALLPVGP
jgi:uncharacterized protein (TIGR03437 family)